MCMQVNAWMADRGVSDHLKGKWFGKDISRDWSVDKMILSPGHVILPIAIIGMAFMSCAMVFLSELMVYFVSKRQRHTL